MNSKTKITIIDLLQVVGDKEVKRALKFHYPRQKGDPVPTIKGFRKMKNFPVEKGAYLNVYACGAPEDFYEDFDIPHTLKDMHEDNYYGIHIKKDGDDTPWSMSFMPWKEAGNLPIDKETLNHYTYPDIIAHFIWEITWYGNEAQTKKTGKGMRKEVEQCIKELKLNKETNGNKQNKCEEKRDIKSKKGNGKKRVGSNKQIKKGNKKAGEECKKRTRRSNAKA